jgi:hypothetical protein
MFHGFSKEASRCRIEKSTDICIHYPVDVQLSALLPQLVQRLMGTVPLPEAVGERMKLMLEDRLQDHHHCPLDDLVLKAGLAYWPLLPPFLLDRPRSWDRPLYDFRGGLRGAGASSTDSKMAANIEHGF